jgi:hypothetical protein
VIERLAIPARIVEMAVYALPDLTPRKNKIGVSTNYFLQRCDIAAFSD